MSMIVVMFLILHALHDFFLYGIHIVHHSDYGHIRCIEGCQRLVQPVFHSAAITDEDIRMLDRANVSRSRFKGMAVHAGRDHHLKINPVSCDLPHKIIIRKQGHRNLQLSVFLRRCIKSALAAHGRCTSPKDQGHAKKCCCQTKDRTASAVCAFFLPASSVFPWIRKTGIQSACSHVSFFLKIQLLYHNIKQLQSSCI